MTERPVFVLTLEATPACELPLHSIKPLLKRAKDAGLRCVKVAIEPPAEPPDAAQQQPPCAAAPKNRGGLRCRQAPAPNGEVSRCLAFRDALSARPCPA